MRIQNKIKNKPKGGIRVKQLEKVLKDTVKNIEKSL